MVINIILIFMYNFPIILFLSLSPLDSPENCLHSHCTEHKSLLWYQTPSPSKVTCTQTHSIEECIASYDHHTDSCIVCFFHVSNPDLSRNERWERGDSMSIMSNLPQTGSLERHRILSECCMAHVLPTLWCHITPQNSKT